MRDQEERRGWQPGDGVRCSEATKAPHEMPCGPPVVTVMRKQEVGPTRKRGVVKRVYCANHSGNGLAPNEIMTQARKVAWERLVSENWGMYQRYVAEAIAQLQAEQESDSAASDADAAC